MPPLHVETYNRITGVYTVDGMVMISPPRPELLMPVVPTVQTMLTTEPDTEWNDEPLVLMRRCAARTMGGRDNSSNQ